MRYPFSGMRSHLHARLWLGAVLIGACVHRPAIVTPPAKVEPPPVVIAPGPAPPPSRVLRILRPKGEEPTPIFSVQADAANVYFNDGAGRLWSAPKDGSAPATALVADPEDSVRSFTIDRDVIYYAARQGVRSVAKTGGASVAWGDYRSGPILVVNDGQHVYHTVFDGSATVRVSVATHKPERFCPGGKHQTLAVDEANLYIASYFGGTIVAVSKKTRRARVLASNVRRPVRLIVDGEHVYFTSESDGTVRRVPKAGGRVEVLARGQREQEHLALDGKYIYWATRLAGGAYALVRVKVAPEKGSQPEQLYAGLRSAAGITVDDRYVFVADRGAGEVVRVMKETETELHGAR